MRASKDPASTPKDFHKQAMSFAKSLKWSLSTHFRVAWTIFLTKRIQTNRNASEAKASKRIQTHPNICDVFYEKLYVFFSQQNFLRKNVLRKKTFLM